MASDAQRVAELEGKLSARVAAAERQLEELRLASLPEQRLRTIERLNKWGMGLASFSILCWVVILWGYLQ